MILFLPIIIIGVVMAIHVVSMLTVDRTLEYKETEYRSAQVSQELDGYVIAFVTDTHSIPQELLQQLIARTNERDVDMLVLGGDMVRREGAYSTIADLGAVRTRDGIYGVEGNHDNHKKLFAAMKDAGMTPLSNSGVRVRDGLYIAGVEDMWNRKPSVAKAVSGAAEGDFVLLVSHNPDVCMEQDTTGIPLMLSGHTHGGQVTLFGLWAPALTLQKDITAYGQRFMGGWARGAYGTDVFTSRGAGSVQVIPRIFARPQVVYLTLRSDLT